MKRALILGVGGQDGSYMAEHLLELGYEVHGFYRRSSVDNLARVRHIADRLILHRGDLADRVSLERAIAASDPAEVYNLADQDHVGASFDAPEYSWQVTAGAPVWLLEAAKLKQFRLLQPISATVLKSSNCPISEADAELMPMSPYACAKAYVWHLCDYYTNAHRVFVAKPILFNHDSVRRKGEYLLHKIAKAVTYNTDLDVEPGASALPVDVGWAPDYVRTMHAMLQYNEPTDYLVGSSSWYTIQGWCHAAGFAGKYVGKGLHSWPQATLVPDDRKARTVLGHQNTKTSKELIQMLIAHYRSEMRG